MAMRLQKCLSGVLYEERERHGCERGIDYVVHACQVVLCLSLSLSLSSCFVHPRERERRVRERGGDVDEARLREAAGDRWKEAVQAAGTDLKAAQV
jgi:hypothetical protein